MNKVLCLLMSLPLTCLASTLYVDGVRGSNGFSGLSPVWPKRTIQAAIDAAHTDDYVLISGGVYLETLRLSKRITLHAYEPQTVKIDGRHAGHCLSINDGAAGCVIDGLTFTRGAPTNAGNKYGGGVDCHVHATIRHCAFLDNGNSSTTFAGGLHTDNGSQVLVQNCLFVNNYAWACGGASLTEGRSTATFDRCTVYGNRSDDYIGNQGGLSVANTGTIIVRGCILWGNTGMQIAAYGSYYGRESTIRVCYSCVQGGVAANGAGHFYNDGGNVSGNPCFINIPKRNFYFPNTSPCWRMGHPDHFEHDGFRSHMGFFPPRPHLRPTPPPPPAPITITLDAQGGECSVTTITRNVWEPIGVLPTPIRDGYDFLGWYDKAEGGNPVKTGVKLNVNRTFYAHWQKRIPPLFQVVGVSGNINTNDITSFAKLQYRLPDSNTVAGVTCAEIKLNGERLTCSVQDSDEWIWQPRKLGKNTFVYTVVTNAVTNQMTYTVNVTGLTFNAVPESNPPMPVDPNIMITGTGCSIPAGGKRATISTQGAGTWTAAVSDPGWMSVTSTGEAGKSVQFTINANTNVSQRIGYVYISGHSYMMTQDGAKETTLSENEIECESDGITGTVDLQFSGQYGWDAHSDVDWITISPTHGKGAATITYTVAPLEYVDTREGYITIGNNRFRVFQYGRRMRLSQYEMAADDYHVDVFPIEIHSLKSTEWTVTPNNSWLSSVYIGTGTGRKDATFAAGENPSYRARTGSVTIGTETLVITQPGTTDTSLSIDPVNTTASVNGANGHIAALATPDMPWTAKSNVGWLTLTSSSVSGAGNANLYYTASPNSTLEERTGTITITPADPNLSPRVHTVVQPASVAIRSCEGYEFAAAGESKDVSVTVSGSVSWDVAESLDWLSVSGPSSCVGSGRVTLQATPNNSIGTRSGVIRLAGRGFQVSQKGRYFEVSCADTAFDTFSDSGYIDVATDGDVDWTAESDSGWLNFENGTGYHSDYGSNGLIFYVDEYVGDGLTRTATITIGSEKIYITQSAYAVEISPSSAKVNGNAGVGEIAVSASSQEVWDALVVMCSKDWIGTVTFGAWDPVSKKGTLTYTYTANDSGVARRGTISINGEQYELEQAARVIVNIAATVVGHGAVEGAGAQTQGETISLMAIPDAGYEFAYWDDPNGRRKEQNPLSVKADVAKSVTAHFTPLTPEFLSATSGTNGVELVWTNLAWVAEYRLYRAPTSEKPANPIVVITSGGECTYLDETGELEKPYWYWIEAVGSEDENPTITQSEVPAGGRRTKPIVIPSNAYLIVYDSHGGGGSMDNMLCKRDAVYSLSVNAFTPPDGKHFAGWQCSKGRRYDDGVLVFNLAQPGETVTMTAIWE